MLNPKLIEIETTKLTVEYRAGSQGVRALDGVDLKVLPGQLVCLLGKSGSGKSSLLHVLAGLQRPSSGRARIGEIQVHLLGPRRSALLRRRTVGLVFQFFNLLPMLTVAQNVAFPLRLERVRGRALASRVEGLLDEIGLRERRDHYPDQLSGGEMQRVAIARALAIEPSVILADEPTGNLDSATGERIWELLRTTNRAHGITMIVVTHDATSASLADRVITLEDGRLVADHTHATAALRSAS